MGVLKLFDLSGKAAIVTGGGRGLGLILAEALAEAGCDLMLCSRKAVNCEEAARKLEQLDSVERLEDLRIPPANRLEALSRDRKGQFSIRINDQYRVCFTWDKSGPDAVEIVDYH